MSGVNNLVQRWRDFAMRDVPKEYSERGLTQFLRTDCAAGGAWDAADELEEVALTAWHPSSEPPTENDAGDSKHVMCVMADGSIQSINYSLVSEFGKTIGPWARINDVVLLPTE